MRPPLLLWERRYFSMVAEQSGSQVRSFMDMTPPTPSPRSSSGRRRRAPERSRSASEERRSQPSTGIGYRLQAVETTVQSHLNELTAQRLESNQLKEVLTTIMKDKDIMGTRLDSCFGLIDTKLSEATNDIDHFFNSAKIKLESMTENINGLASTAQGRLDSMSWVLDQLRTDQLTRDQQRAPPAPPAAPPPAPASWVGTAETHDQRSSPGFGTTGTNTHGNGIYVEPLINAQQPTAERHMPFERPAQKSTAERHMPFEQPPFHTANGSRNPFFETHVPQNSGPAGPVHYGIGSPGSPLTTPGAQGSATHQWAAGAGTELKPFDPKDWTVDSKEPSKELRSYDGDMAHYDAWRRRVRDHFMSVNCNYSKLFDLIEAQKSPINWFLLSTTRMPQFPHMNWEWIATHAWTFISGYLGDDLMKRRMTLTNGQ